MATGDDSANKSAGETDLDVAVVGAGFSGLYLLHRLRGLGLSAKVFEAADDVGGTWYWNRYPGARCDITSVEYSYSFDPELEAEWEWSEKYATQPEILSYLRYVADRYDLRRDIAFSTRVEHAEWDDGASRWRLRTADGEELTCRFYVMATGCLSLPKTPDIEGADRFEGEVYSTSRWPHEGVDFAGKRVGVIGTGSSGIQSIPLIAAEAAAVTVFQRTANFSIPAHNGPHPPESLAALAADRDGFREASRRSRGGVNYEAPEEGAMAVSADERRARYEARWDEGELIPTLGAFSDILSNPAANETLAEFIREKIRAVVEDPETAETLCPSDHPVGAKRLCLDTGYYETYNLPHVRLVDLRKQPIVTITEHGIDTTDESLEFDALVLATGFDAMTGAIVAVDIVGRDGLTLKEKWADGPENYLGLTVAGFPNLFTVTGPGSPSVLSNMVVSIEQHVDWICDCLSHMTDQQLEVIEATPTAEAGWVQHVNDFADLTLYPLAASWYMGANVPGKPRVFLPYVGGVGTYRDICDEVTAADYLGFAFAGTGGRRCHDGVVRRVQPDVALVLEFIASLDLPDLDSLPVADARGLYDAMAAQRPPGPDVGEILDATLPGADGELPYRLYRPATPGPHPLVAYFHGGGMVFGGSDSDDPFCRDLCVRSDAVVVSVGYRLAPEHRFPSAVDDGFAAVQWLENNAGVLGAEPGRLAVFGWSAGGTVAAVVCQMARAAGGPAIAGQVLVNPMLDADFTRTSYTDNGEGYVLTKSLMEWFWDHYTDPADRKNPKASPLHAADLSGLPPALIVTSEFDVLRDEGDAYAAALADAGVHVRHLRCRGHIHTSLTAIDLIPSGVSARAQMGDALREYLGATT